MRLMLSYSIRQFGRKVNNNKQKQYANKFACLLTVQKWSRKRGSASVAASASERAAVKLKRTAATSAWLTQLTSSLSLAQPASQLLGLLITVNRLPCPRPPPSSSSHSPLLLCACCSTRFQSTRFHFNFQFDFVAFFAKQLFSVLLVLFCFECIATHTLTHTHKQRHADTFAYLYLYLCIFICDILAALAWPSQAKPSRAQKAFAECSPMEKFQCSLLRVASACCMRTLYLLASQQTQLWQLQFVMWHTERRVLCNWNMRIIAALSSPPNGHFD